MNEGATLCPHCGAVIEARMDFCFECGAALRAPARRNGCLTAAGTLVLGVAALGFGFLGTCFLFIGANAPAASQLGVGRQTSAWGLGALMLFGVCLWTIARLHK